MPRILTYAVLAGALAVIAAPALAQDQDHDRQRGRGRSDERRGERTQPAPPANRAVPRTTPPPQASSRRDNDRRDNDRRDNDRRDNDRRGNDRRDNDRRGYGGYDRRDNNGYNWRGYDRRSYDRGRVVIVPRIVRPSIIGVIPYRPYVYRPSYRSYGYGYYDPYAYPAAPYGYYDPIPGRPYGGVRITGVPRDAQVFADGYYVGVVNDFDGIFQHLNLEAGPHHIEIVEPGLQPIAFDVIVRPGQTITYRAEIYGAYQPY